MDVRTQRMGRAHLAQNVEPAFYVLHEVEVVLWFRAMQVHEECILV